MADLEFPRNREEAYLYGFIDSGTEVPEPTVRKEAYLKQIIDHFNLTKIQTPQDFGAVGDGITDDTEAIQKALNASRRVYIPAGEYKTTAPLYVRSNSEVFGDGPETIINNAGTGWNKNVIFVGFTNGVSESPNISETTAIIYTKKSISSFEITGEITPTFAVGDIVLFAKGNLSSTGQAESLGTVITEAVNGVYSVSDYIPDGATLHAFKDVGTTGPSGLELYTCSGSYVHDLKVTHLRTGSGMYGVWVCGAFNVLDNIYIDANTPLASNLAIHCTLRNINGISHNGIQDIAEFIYNSYFERINISESYISGETVQRVFALGRGNGNIYDNCRYSSVNDNTIAVTYSTVTVKNSVFNGITRVPGNSNVSFYNCEFGDNLINASANFYGCTFINGISDTLQYNFRNNVSINQSSYSPRVCVHQKGWGKHIKVGIPSGTTYNFTPFDFGCYLKIWGTGITFRNANGTSTYGDGCLTIVMTPEGTNRVIDPNGAVYPAGSLIGGSYYEIMGTALEYYEQGSLVN